MQALYVLQAMNKQYINFSFSQGKLFFSNLLILFIVSGAFADSTDEMLANQYFRDGQYEQALALYEGIFQDNRSPVIYNNYLESLLRTESFRRAERLINQLIDEHPDEIRYKVDLGYVYGRAGNTRRERRHMDALISDLKANQRQVIDLALAFEVRGYIDRALEIYLRGRELLSADQPLHLRIAELYERKGNYDSMMREYLEYMDKFPGEVDRVRGLLQDALSNDPGQERNDALRRLLLMLTQREPENIMYAEMLLWLSIQQQDFRIAFMQARALDRRLRQEGKQVLEVAELSVRNRNYSVAREAYQYILNLGDENRNYLNALVGYLNVRFLSVTEDYDFELTDLIEIEQEYIRAIDEIGIRANTVQLVRNLANLQAFYLGKTDEAINLLQSIIDMRGISNRVKGTCQVELADILLYTGEVWDATLLYAQVDRMFRDDPLAHEAKFKNARLSYFIGEFDWAKAQLDILKAGTSRLIANDAMRLSLRIQDNIGQDGNTEPLKMFARAEQHIFMNRFTEAIEILDSIAKRFQGHQINDDILFAHAEIMYKTNDYVAADSLLAKIVKTYPNGVLADEALFRRAELQQYYFQQNDKAMSLYQDIMLNYPGSVHVITARNRFRTLRGDVIN